MLYKDMTLERLNAELKINYAVRNNSPYKSDKRLDANENVKAILREIDKRGHEKKQTGKGLTGLTAQQKQDRNSQLQRSIHLVKKTKNGVTVEYDERFEKAVFYTDKNGVTHGHAKRTDVTPKPRKKSINPEDFDPNSPYLKKSTQAAKHTEIPKPVKQDRNKRQVIAAHYQDTKGKWSEIDYSLTIGRNGREKQVLNKIIETFDYRQNNKAYYSIWDSVYKIVVLIARDGTYTLKVYRTSYTIKNEWELVKVIR